MDFLEFGHLLVILCYDPFPAVFMGDAVFLTELVEELFASETEFCFQRGGTVVEACVYYLIGVRQG